MVEIVERQENLPNVATPDPAHQRSTEEQHMRLGIVDFLGVSGLHAASLTELLVRLRGAPIAVGARADLTFT